MIDGAVPALSTTPAIQDNTLVNWWPDTAPDLSGFFVQGGSQSGPYAITAQMGADPGEAGTDWEDVVELSVMTAGAITINEVVDGPVETLPVPPGTYRLRLSSRGRTEGYERAASFPDEDEARSFFEFGSEQFEAVEGIGDAAYRSEIHEITVLHDRYEIDVTLYFVSEDDDEEFEMARELAEMMIDRLP